MAIIYDKRPLSQRVKSSLDDKFAMMAIHKAQDTFYSKRKALVDQLPEWEDFREEAAELRDHTLKHLGYYLKQFVENATKAGAKVHFAYTDKEASQYALDILKAKEAKIAVKAKSMITEEISLNELLIQNGIEVDETDLAEFILQTADNNPPSHIVVPALHFARKQIRETFAEKLGYEGTEDPEEMTRFVRRRIRDRFLKADVGFTGCNFAVAETGSITLVSNEGNGRMSSSMPKTMITFMGMERLVPNLASLDVMMELLIRSSVGSKISNYFSLVTGPRAEGEADGPEELHIIIVDNGRSGILGGEFTEMLRCIRCGACMNICPVYRHITGHGYGSIYPGPMGAVLTPLFKGYDEAGELPYASTLCGACTDHCPVKIPLHELLLKHRSIMASTLRKRPLIERGIFSAVGTVFGNEKLYDLGTKVGALGMKLLAGKDGNLSKATSIIPVLGGWTKHKDMNTLKGKKFRDLYKEHKAKKAKGGK